MNIFEPVNSNLCPKSFIILPPWKRLAQRDHSVTNTRVASGSQVPRGASPVHLGREHAHHRGRPVDVDDVGDGLQHVEVEEGLPRHGAVQPRLHERRPVLLQDPLRPAHVVLTDPGDSGVHHLREAAESVTKTPSSG